MEEGVLVCPWTSKQSCWKSLDWSTCSLLYSIIWICFQGYMADKEFDRTRKYLRVLAMYLVFVNNCPFLVFFWGKKGSELKNLHLRVFKKRTGREPMVFGWLLDFCKQEIENPSSISESVLWFLRTVVMNLRKNWPDNWMGSWCNLLIPTWQWC
jgi:hypothetical protein